MSTETFRSSLLHHAIRDALQTMRQPATWASVGLAAGATGISLPALALDSDTSTARVSNQSQQRSNALLVLDAGVADAELLLRDLPAGVRTARLPRDVEPLQGLRMLLEAHPGTRELHVVSHGAPGRLEFAGGAVDRERLDESAKDLATWFTGVDRPEIVLYGCDVAADRNGLAFIDALARHTGARISASDDPTGSSERGGDWTLERSTALASRAPLFGEAARTEFQGLLATFTVSNSDDGVSGSLRAAIDSANAAPGPDTIEFDPSLAGSTISLNRGELFIDDDLEINGLGADDLTIDAGRNSRVMLISGNASEVSISGLTLTGGFARYSNGGAILSYASSSLTISDSMITGNEAGYYYYYDRRAEGQRKAETTISGAGRSPRGGGGCPFYAGGGIAQVGGLLRVEDSSVTNNTAKYDGGGILFCPRSGEDRLELSNATITGNTAGGSSGAYEGVGGGVSVHNDNYSGSIEISSSTISSNSATQGGGLAITPKSYGPADGIGPVTITASTLSMNVAEESGGGLFMYGRQTDPARGVASYIEITDTQITDNRARGNDGGGAGGGLFFFQSYGSSAVLIQDSTISGNEALAGGGIGLEFGAQGSTVQVDNSTIEQNTASLSGLGPSDRGPSGRGRPVPSGFGGGVLMFNARPVLEGPFGSLSIIDSRVADNRADFAGGGISAATTALSPPRIQQVGGTDAPQSGRGGPPILISDLEIENSTISGNSASVGGGLSVRAEGNRTLSMINSTVSGNTASVEGGAIDLYGIIGPVRGYDGLAIDIDLTTIADNNIGQLPPRGGQIKGIALDNAGARITNSIVANDGIDVNDDIEASYSLIQDPGAGVVITGSGNITLQDPELGPLADNGGPTRTHLPDPTSPTVDAGDSKFIGPPNFDQRGDGFPRVQNSRVDMGSVEIESVPPNIVIAPITVNFGVNKLGVTSPAESVTISNTGGLLTVDDISMAGGAFAAAGGDCGATPFDLANDESCTLDFTFTPIAVGVDSLSFLLTTNDPDGPDSFTLTGEGALGELSITPDPANFGGVLAGTTSSPQSVTLENIGVVDLEVSAVDAATAPFATIGGDCGSAPFTLAPTATCTIDYTFAPAVVGPANQALDVTNDGTASPEIINLTGVGTGEASVGISTDDFDFGTIALGTGGSTLIELTNTGTLPLDISSITDPEAPFSLTFGSRGAGLCEAPPFTIGVAGSCNVQVNFDPFAPGDYLSSFDILSNAPSSPDTVNLSGRGDEPIAVPAMSSWGLALMGGLMALLGWIGVRRREPDGTQ